MLAWTLGLILVAAAVLMSWGLLASLSQPERACGEEVPVAEGLVISDAERSWTPPLIRCTWVDTDLGEGRSAGTMEVWNGRRLAALAITDSAAVAVITSAARRIRARRFQKG